MVSEPTVVPTPEELNTLVKLAEDHSVLAGKAEALEAELFQKQAAEQAYSRLLPDVVDAMADSGIIDFHEKSAMLQSLQSSPTTALRILVKMARRVGPVSLGEVSEQAGTTGLDPIAQFALYGDR